MSVTSALSSRIGGHRTCRGPFLPPALEAAAQENGGNVHADQEDQQNDDGTGGPFDEGRVRPRRPGNRPATGRAVAGSRKPPSTGAGRVVGHERPTMPISSRRPGFAQAPRRGRGCPVRMPARPAADVVGTRSCQSWMPPPECLRPGSTAASRGNGGERVAAYIDRRPGSSASASQRPHQRRRRRQPAEVDEDRKAEDTVDDGGHRRQVRDVHLDQHR